MNNNKYYKSIRRQHELLFSYNLMSIKRKWFSIIKILIFIPIKGTTPNFEFNNFHMSIEHKINVLFSFFYQVLYCSLHSKLLQNHLHQGQLWNQAKTTLFIVIVNYLYVIFCALSFSLSHCARARLCMCARACVRCLLWFILEKT